MGTGRFHEPGSALDFLRRVGRIAKIEKDPGPRPQRQFDIVAG
jgi:hypothetical protein